MAEKWTADELQKRVEQAILNMVFVVMLRKIAGEPVQGEELVPGTAAAIIEMVQNNA